MAVLSNIAIQEAIKSGKLLIDPIPQPYNQEPGGAESPYNTSSVDLTLGSEISVPQATSAAVDLMSGARLASFITQNSTHHKLTSQQPYRLAPGSFVLAQTREKIELPLTGGLAARIEGKSSVARCGILIHFTAPTVHPGFRGPLTLEITNLGPNTFLLIPDMAIAQLIVEEVIGTLAPHYSQFQDQKTPAGL